MHASQRLSRVVVLALFLATDFYGLLVSSRAPAQAAGGTEFVGAVLSVDPSSGKFAVKKDGGGSRFTFVADDKTHFDGGLQGLKDLKKDDHVAVVYQVKDSQYVALNVTLTK
jgi:hypothetical protein